MVTRVTHHGHEHQSLCFFKCLQHEKKPMLILKLILYERHLIKYLVRNYQLTRIGPIKIVSCTWKNGKFFSSVISFDVEVFMELETFCLMAPKLQRKITVDVRIYGTLITRDSLGENSTFLFKLVHYGN